MVRCHYEVMGIAQTASLEEIRSAYKKLALKWHPDKNQDNPEHATAVFKEIQASYEVLSDKHERAWYDSHRDSILKSHSGDDEDDIIDIWSYFSTSAYNGFHNETGGFYEVYSAVFQKIYDQECFVAKREGRDGDLRDLERRRPPAFGIAGTSHDDVAAFYKFWQGFASKREFADADAYNLAEAPNRKVRRLMEEENAKLRKKERKEWNEAVRQLAAFVRKRDPRAAERAAELRRAAAAKEAEAARRREEEKRRKEERMRRFQEPSWATGEEEGEEEEEEDENEGEEAEEEEEGMTGTEQAEGVELKGESGMGSKKSSKKHLVDDDEDDWFGDSKEKKKGGGRKSKGDSSGGQNGKGAEASVFVEEETNMEGEEGVRDDSEPYCVVCDKLFRSLKQLRNHQQSKKHREAVEALREELRREEEEVEEGRSEDVESRGGEREEEEEVGEGRGDEGDSGDGEREEEGEHEEEGSGEGVAVEDAELDGKGDEEHGEDEEGRWREDTKLKNGMEVSEEENDEEGNDDTGEDDVETLMRLMVRQRVEVGEGKEQDGEGEAGSSNGHRTSDDEVVVVNGRGDGGSRHGVDSDRVRIERERLGGEDQGRKEGSQEEGTVPEGEVRGKKSRRRKGKGEGVATKTVEGEEGGKESGMARESKESRKEQEERERGRGGRKGKQKGRRDAVEENQCGICQQVFGSRNKLFKHISSTGHAQLKQ